MASWQPAKPSHKARKTVRSHVAAESPNSIIHSSDFQYESTLLAALQFARSPAQRRSDESRSTPRRRLSCRVADKHIGRRRLSFEEDVVQKSLLKCTDNLDGAALPETGDGLKVRIDIDIPENECSPPAPQALQFPLPPVQPPAQPQKRRCRRPAIYLQDSEPGEYTHEMESWLSRQSLHQSPRESNKTDWDRCAVMGQDGLLCGSSERGTVLPAIADRFLREGASAQDIRKVQTADPFDENSDAFILNNDAFILNPSPPASSYTCSLAQPKSQIPDHQTRPQSQVVSRPTSRHRKIRPCSQQHMAQHRIDLGVAGGWSQWGAVSEDWRDSSAMTAGPTDSRRASSQTADSGCGSFHHFDRENFPFDCSNFSTVVVR